MTTREQRQWIDMTELEGRLAEAAFAADARRFVSEKAAEHDAAVLQARSFMETNYPAIMRKHEAATKRRIEYGGAPSSDELSEAQLGRLFDIEMKAAEDLDTPKLTPDRRTAEELEDALESMPTPW